MFNLLPPETIAKSVIKAINDFLLSLNNNNSEGDLLVLTSFIRDGSAVFFVSKICRSTGYISNVKEILLKDIFFSGSSSYMLKATAKMIGVDIENVIKDVISGLSSVMRIDKKYIIVQGKKEPASFIVNLLEDNITNSSESLDISSMIREAINFLGDI